MNIIFMGTPSIALPPLDALAATWGVAAVFTTPDAASHRGKKLLPSPVKARAAELGICVHTPRSFYARLEDGAPLLGIQGKRVVDAELLAAIEHIHPDVIIVVAYGMILPPEVLVLPKVACINLHASLLPRWRGAAPIQRALLAGDEQTGVSIMRMEAGLDTGPYCLQEKTSTAGKNYQQLMTELGSIGARMLTENLEGIVAGTIPWTAQDESLVTYANKIEKGSIDLSKALTVEENNNRVRASSHHARCRATFFGRQAMVLEACSARPDATTSGENGHLYYECSDGLLEILTLKPNGKKEMSGAAFLAGVR